MSLLPGPLERFWWLYVLEIKLLLKVINITVLPAPWENGVVPVRTLRERERAERDRERGERETKRRDHLENLLFQDLTVYISKTSFQVDEVARRVTSLETPQVDLHPTTRQLVSEVTPLPATIDTKPKEGFVNTPRNPEGEAVSGKKLLLNVFCVATK